MFGTLGGPEVLLLLVLALIVFGPRKLPEIGKSMGKMLAEFRRASNDFKRTIEEEVEAEKLRTVMAEDLPAAPPPVLAAPPPAPSEPLTAGEPGAPAETAGAAEAPRSEPDSSPPALRPPDESVSRG